MICVVSSNPQTGAHVSFLQVIHLAKRCVLSKTIKDRVNVN